MEPESLSEVRAKLGIFSSILTDLEIESLVTLREVTNDPNVAASVRARAAADMAKSLDRTRPR